MLLWPCITSPEMNGQVLLTGQLAARDDSINPHDEALSSAVHPSAWRLPVFPASYFSTRPHCSINSLTQSAGAMIFADSQTPDSPPVQAFCPPRAVV
ncbi:hypothetical protein [Pantoea dispersa]|uniref:hypothetical protein n=1 Tax=Pantoea dispersa TaxID=59814 RepID=UPI001CA740F8|nr:hypothetical protein [Pantoea dispersa]QZY95869.1 hypothetical protein K7X52_05345 [Pantoea dispersa]